jgi:A/G-specific adenine glycosylase
MPPKSNSKQVNAFRRRLAAWYRRAARDLPWRRTRDPYAIVVSEFMLQQTQVARVLEFYPRFLARYPTLDRLARARPAAVRESWDGLGYYRRAENLHRLARAVMAQHGGRLPEGVAELQKLPGVGPYTAGAVACFAHERPAPTVDTNVARVLRRVFLGDPHVGGRRAHRPGTARRVKGGRSEGVAPPLSPRALREFHLTVQPRRGRAAYVFNQALMELGALVCTARAPKCPTCPARGVCRSYAGLAAAK